MPLSKFMLGLAALLVPAAVRAAPVQNRVAVLEVRTIDLPDLGRDALREAVVDGIKAHGGIAIDPHGVPAGQPAVCDTPDCYKAVAAATGATYVLRIDGSYGDDRYDLQLQIWNGRTGEVVTSERERCKLCLADDMIRLARSQTSDVVDRAFSTESTRTRTKAALDASGDPGHSGDSFAVRSPSARVAGEPRPPSDRWLGWTLAGVGGASAVAAAIEWSRDNQSFNCADVAGEGQVCLMRHRTWPAALALAGAAILGGGFGTWLLVRSSARTSEISLSVAPASIGLGGVF